MYKQKKWFCFVAKLNRRECFDQLLSGSCQLPELLHIALQKVTTTLFFSKLVLLFDLLFLQICWDNVLLFCIQQYSIFIHSHSSLRFDKSVRMRRASADGSKSVILFSKNCRCAFNLEALYVNWRAVFLSSFQSEILNKKY